MKSFFLIGFLIVLARSASLHMENDARNNNVPNDHARNNNMKNENEKTDEKIWGDEEDRQDNKAFKNRRRMQRIQSKRMRGEQSIEAHEYASCEEKCTLECSPYSFILLAYGVCWGVCYGKECKYNENDDENASMEEMAILCRHNPITCFGKH